MLPIIELAQQAYPIPAHIIFINAFLVKCIVVVLFLTYFVNKNKNLNFKYLF